MPTSLRGSAVGWSPIRRSSRIRSRRSGLSRDKSANGLRDRRGEVLFIDARNMGHMVDRVRREFSDEDIDKIAGTYRRWRAKPETLEEKGWEAYADEPGFCKSEGLETIRKIDHVLTPGRYVGAAAAEADDVPFEEQFAALKETLAEQFDESNRQERLIRNRLEGLLP